MITTAEFNDALRGFRMTDCVVRNNQYFHPVARNEAESAKEGVLSEHTVARREIGFYSNPPEGRRVGGQALTSFATPFAGASQALGER